MPDTIKTLHAAKAAKNDEFYTLYEDVDKTKDIPRDYYGEMGVPISFLGKWCTEQFDILGGLGAGTSNKNGYVYGKGKFARLVIKRKVTSVRAR